MSRDIKVRAWDKSRGIMIANPTTNGWANINYIFQNDEDQDYIWMQYIGIHDYNNKEIYEGDICLYALDEFSEKTVVRIEYRDDLCAFVMIGLENWPCIMTQIHKGNRFLKIIGDIYNNPDLINKEWNNDDEKRK